MSEEQGKKRERVREQEGGREKGSERGREREAAAVWKSRKVARSSHRKTLGLEEARGSCASHQLPICHSLTALSNRVLSRFYQWRLRQWNGRSLHWAACPLEHQALLTYPEGSHFSSPPFSLLFLLCSFFTTNHIFLLSLVSLAGFLSVKEGLQRVNKGLGH